MRSVNFDCGGEPSDVLTVREMPLPVLQPGEVLVRMRVSPVNPSDLYFIRGIYTQKPIYPAIPGFEGMGIVQQGAGSLLAKFLVGKRVAVIGGEQGHWREFSVAKARQVIPVSRDLTDEVAAMFFVNPATALMLIERVLKVPRGGWVMQSAANSALGRMVIRLGQYLGFHTLNLVRRDSSIDELRALGADAVVAFDPARHAIKELQQRIQQQTGLREVPLGMDCVGGKTGEAMIACLARRGHLVVYGTLSHEPIQLSSRQLIQTGGRISGFWLSQAMQELGLLSKLRLVRRIAKLLRAGVLTTEVGQRFPLEKIVEAVRAAEQPGHRGKVLLTMGASPA